MTPPTRWRHVLSVLVAAVCAAFFATALAATPAQAAISNPDPVYIQLRSQDASYNTTLVGLAVGTVQFHDSNSSYRLSLTVCRQGSYTFPNLDIYVNGTVRLGPPVYQTNPRPEVCLAAYPYSNSSGLIEGDFSFNGTIFNLKICLQGVHFTNPVKYPQRCVTYDNPFN